MKSQFLKNKAESLETYVFENNQKLIPTSALITIYKPGGELEFISETAMNIGSDGLLSYDLTAINNEVATADYRAIISYVYSGKTYYLTLFYDVVNSKLLNVITDRDLVAELPQLKDSGWMVHGTAKSGSLTTIIDSELKIYEDDYFTGGLAYSIDKDETRVVTDFVSDTGTLSVEDFGSAITTDKYVLTRSFTREIQRAFEKVEERLIRVGKRPELVLDSYDLREVHLYYSVAEVCKGLVIESGSLWWEMWKDYESKAEVVFSAINFKYDTSGDGYITGGESSSTLSVLKTGRA
ncbi:MAG: hypothetical protein KAT46_08040 [Deltaproteobacteria bacterium]|nr:hypothetical protein [Deltaproteobacteria bacterium]